MTESLPAGPPSPFRTTRWSLVAAAGGSGDAARCALAELAERYWYPVYAYLRRCGHAPVAAQAIAGSFFRTLAVKSPTLPGGPEPGRFRTFLFDALNADLTRAASIASQGAEAAPPCSVDQLETRLLGDAARTESPVDSFQRSFARELLLNALLRLRQEAQGAGRQALFERLEPLLTEEPVPGQMEALAAALTTRPLALVIALKRLRQRFRELVESEIAETVDSPEALAAERLDLQRLLGGTE